MSDRNIAPEIPDAVVDGEQAQLHKLPQGRLFRFLLLRRKIDPVLLAAGMAAFAVRLPLDMIVFAYFIGSGVYFLAFRHRISQRVDPEYRRWCLIYVAYAVLIGLLFHHNLPSEIRWIGYPVYLTSGILLMVGFALVKDPLRQIVLGARIATVIALPLAVIELLGGETRIGFGGNEANAAFVLIVVSLLSCHPVRMPPRYLPNSSLWFYFGAAVVMMTGTRSLLPVILLALAFDIFRFWRARKSGLAVFSARHKGAVVAGGIVLVAVGAVAGTSVGTSLSQRVDTTVVEFYDAMGDATPGQEATGLGIRMTLWKNAIDVIARHPLIGLGGVESMRQIREMVPPEQRELFASYVHVHNFVLDELRQRGGVGLVLLLCFFVAVSRKIWRGGDGPVRETLSLLLLSLLSYGALHGVLLGDRNVLLISIVLAALLLETHRRGNVGVRTRLIPVSA